MLSGIAIAALIVPSPSVGGGTAAAPLSRAPTAARFRPDSSSPGRGAGSRTKTPVRRCRRIGPGRRRAGDASQNAGQESTDCSLAATLCACSRSARPRSRPSGLTDCRIPAPERASSSGSSVWRPETPETSGPSAKACRNCGSTTDRATGCISRSGAARSSYCWRARTSVPKTKTSRRPCASHETCRWTT